ncbi:lipocalin-like domain-containing protein [Actibacterium pelagium]|uniref:Iron ABC transporter permease n=1 Tax=Actibacterium pelagium TaxID=2029103 RepID=A0A917AK83_9RHOB|nr:lipocalin-like domain-containing protein [Actibacterium pelagium]GGE57645.1 iron ABC transporter permease [Actibacterium pelagium]
MNVRGLLVCICLLLGGQGFAQGFAGLGTSAEGFPDPERGTPLQFPRDHGAHPEYRIEWWYVTANLTGEDGRDYGVQWTLFRAALDTELAEGWLTPQIWKGHAAVTTPNQHFFAESFARGGVGQAGAKADPVEVWIDDWQLAGPDINTLQLTATDQAFSFDLGLRADGPLVLHGDQGYSVKSREGKASYYYSQPAYKVRGQLSLPDGSVGVSGHAWLDREWSSQPLSDDQRGWDWVSLTFDSGDRLMGFQLRSDDGVYTSGTWIGADGEVAPFGDGVLKLKPLSISDVNGRKVPTGWQVDLPDRDVSVQIDAINPNAWMTTLFPYWEGPMRITGSHTGRGYLEMTGY